MEKLKLVKYNNIDTFERWATFTHLDTKIPFIAHFLDSVYEDKTIKEGTIIEARIIFNSIGDFEYMDINEKLTTVYLNEKTSYAEAIVKITRCTEDKYSYWAKCNLFKNDILLEFEHAVDCKVGDVIKIRGEFFVENEKLGIYRG